MYDFRMGRRQDPFGPDPMGPDYERLMNPTQNLQGFQFSQDPNSMMAPQMGIGPGGTPETPNYMNFMAGGEGGAMGGNAAGGMMAAAKLANMGAQETPPPSAQAGRGAGIQETMLNWDFWNALNEMKQNKRRK